VFVVVVPRNDDTPSFLLKTGTAGCTNQSLMRIVKGFCLR
jgi:hypothetical protein